METKSNKSDPIINLYNVKSLTSINKLAIDGDVGVVRVSNSFIKKYSKRNSLLKITKMDNSNNKAKSIVRIARGCALKENEIALQYDDRIKLGIKNVDKTHRLTIIQVNKWCGLLPFFWNHTSPFIRLQTIFAFTLFILGLVFGFLLGKL